MRDSRPNYLNDQQRRCAGGVGGEGEKWREEALVLEELKAEGQDKRNPLLMRRL